MGERVVINPEEAEPVRATPLEYGTNDNWTSRVKHFIDVRLHTLNHAMKDKWQLVFAGGTGLIFAGIGSSLNPYGFAWFPMGLGAFLVCLSVRFPFLRK
jgi:hypothetical protein